MTNPQKMISQEPLLVMEAGAPVRLPAKAERAKTIIFLGNANLFATAVEFLLTLEKTWKVVRMPNDRNQRRLCENMKSLKPNIVILYQGRKASNTQLIVQLLRDCIDLRVISISLEDNSIQVYNTQKFHISTASDLLSVVEV